MIHREREGSSGINIGLGQRFGRGGNEAFLTVAYFQPEDRVVSFNGTQINNSNEFITLVRKCKVGDTVTVVVSRKGQQIEIKTVLEELQQQQP